MACTTAAELQYRGKHWYRGREGGELELASASEGAAMLSRCGQPQPLFLIS